MVKYRDAGKVLKSGNYVFYRSRLKEFVIDKEILGTDENVVFYPDSESVWQVSTNNAGKVELINYIGQLDIHDVDYAKLDKVLKELANRCVNSLYAESGRYIITAVVRCGRVYVLVTLKSMLRIASGNGQKEKPYEITFF